MGKTLTSRRAMFVALLLLGAALPAASAQSVSDAVAFLRRIVGAQPAATTEDGDQLKQDLRKFQPSTLAPDVASQQWLELAARFMKVPAEKRWRPHDEERLNFKDVLRALPPPEAWPTLGARLAVDNPVGKADSARVIGLRAMVSWLSGDESKAAETVSALRGLKAKVPDNRERFVDAMEKARFEKSDDGTAAIAFLLGQLDQYADDRYATLYVPDLVTMAGREKAAAFLEGALTKSTAEIRIESGDETRKLAREIALRQIDNLKAAQWDLAESIDALALYEGMARRFPQDSTSMRWQQKTARSYYLLGLVAAGRTEDAADLAQQIGRETDASLSDQAVRALEGAGKTRELAEFLHTLLARDPDLPFWRLYVPIATKAGEGGRMLALAEAAARRSDLSQTRRMRVLGHLRAGYLAMDRIDEALRVLREEVALERAAGGKPEPDGDYSRWKDPPDAGLTLVRLGELLQRPELIDEGVGAVRAAGTASSDEGKVAHARLLNQLAALLMILGRATDAESVVDQALAAAPEVPLHQSHYESSRPETLALQFAVHLEAGRPAEALALLDTATQWHADDVLDLVDRIVPLEDGIEYLGVLIAEALAAVERTGEARSVLDAFFERIGGHDPAYELLMKLEGDGAVARLETLFARDQFEERPLIWKAKRLLEKGQVEAAEATARQAIATDPSDGEQGRGRRMSVYAVLAEARAALGDTKEAELLRGAVTAIRKSEDADRLYAAGLIGRAVQQYEEALRHFADAYCIQSRLALRLAESGDVAGAEEHYRRAYELMPDSFGRVESHCFGCERAFDGERAQSIAERVFTSIVAKRPENPQVHYLLGYLRKEEGRYAEAVPEFREAVRLDPQYLNAWKQLAETHNTVRLPAADREAIQLNLVRLDPLGRHSHFDIKHVGNMRTAWDALAAAWKLRSPVPAQLLPLQASAEAIEKSRRAEPKQRDRYVFYGSRDGENLQPAAALAEHPIMSRLGDWFDSSRRLAEE